MVAIRVAFLVSVVAAGGLVAQTNRLAAPRPAMVGFGAAVAVAGDQAFVGRTGLVSGFPMPSAETGAVHVFARNASGEWAETGTVTGTGGAVGDGFGGALAVAGDRMIVGASGRAEGAGRVYLFERRGTRWTQVASFDGPAAGAGFGTAVAIAGDLAVVGAPGHRDGAGAAFVLRRNPDGTWGQPVGFGAAAANDRFGAAVAVDAGRILVGAPGPVSFGGPPAPPMPGWIGVFGTGATPAEVARLRAPATDSAGALGASLALSGRDVIAGAPLTNQGAGAVYRFPASGAPVKVLPTDATPASLFGLRITASGTDLAVAAPVAGGVVGAVYLFTAGPAGFSQKQRLSVRPSGMGTMFGAGVAMAGDLLVIGAPMAEFFEGLGYVYRREGAEWKERGSLINRPAGLPAITGSERRCQPGGGDIEGFACRDVDLAAFIPASALGAKRGIMINDVWGWTDPDTNREYALVGRMDGTVFVDITDASNPRVLGELPMHQGSQANLWRDIKTYRNHAYIVADGAGPHGMQVFDLTRLRRVTNPPEVFTETAHYDRIASAHNIVIDESTGFAFTVGNSAGGETCGGALHMIDIRDPAKPVFAGCHADPATGSARTGYTHDAQCVTYHGPDTRFTGRAVCFNASETAVGIADVTDKKAPKPIGVAAYPNTSYAHQGWLTEDHRYFYLDDEGDEIAGNAPRTRTLIWDVTKLDEPVLVKEFFGTTAASDHNLYIKGNHVFQSNYVAGLRILDITDPANPRETGYFDTVPFGENVPGFAGTWSNYPYFKSGAIIVTSMREGLFIVKHRPERPVP